MDVNTNDITICRVINSVDKMAFVLSTDWCEDHVKVTVIRSDDVPLKGQITKVKLAEPAETFLRTAEEYLEEMKRELAGKDNEIEFSLQNNILKWKRKKTWTRGFITCEPLSDIILFSSLVHGILICKSSVEESEIKYREENENLKRKVSDMESSMIKMISLKDKMEDVLCRKFLFILKTKKDLIRNLRDEIKNLSKAHSVYDKSTDVSDNENDDEVELEYPIKRIKMDNLCSELVEKIPMKRKSHRFTDSIFEKIVENIERENSLLPSDEKKIADMTNNNDNSNDSDINLRYDDSQAIVEPNNHSQDLFSSQ